MTDQAMGPLHRRMIEDMTIRHDYLQRVKNFAAFLGRSPDMASFEDRSHTQIAYNSRRNRFIAFAGSM